MIRRVYSDLPTFKTLTFGEGLNVLLAEKSEGASQLQTRNRAGKSSMVELFHFLLGAKASKDSLFRNPALEPYMFGMEFELGGDFTRVERTGQKASPLRVAGTFDHWPVAPKKNKDDICTISNDNWRRVLGSFMLGLEDWEDSWTPTFRSGFSYFARRERSGGFQSPMQQSTKQHLADQQINISYLLGLDWSVPHTWQQLREREKSLKALKKSLKQGSFGQVVQKASTIKTKLVLARDKVTRLKRQVSSFKIIEEYHELEREASQLTQRLGVLADENTLDRRYIADLEHTTAEEIPPEPADLVHLYREVGIVLPDLVHKRFEEVRVFHESVVKNRGSYLRSELTAAEKRITDRDAEQQRLDSRRAQIMEILHSSGALEHFTALQGEVARTEAEVEVLRHKYEAAEALESGSIKLKVERGRLQERLHQDYSEQAEVVERAILTFQKISSSLYEESKAGSLTINPTDNGPEFVIEIQGSKSKGVNNMQIFCFDMMLALLSLERGRCPGFLIHDSHLFDGVDERQVGRALALGAELASEHGFQYIVTMNTDDIPAEVPSGFNVEDHALDVRLSDATEDGGLFGFRFD